MLEGKLAGTISLSPLRSIDVRTVDFLRIVEALRERKAECRFASQLLEDVDVFGINMICADGLDAEEFTEFAELVSGLCRDSAADRSDFHDFVVRLCDMVRADERIVRGKS